MMSHVVGLFINIVFCLAAIEIQIITKNLIQEVGRIRWAVASSEERCPTAEAAPCAVVIAARSYGRWTPCDQDHPPSGADLPMHRWFRVTGQCPVDVGPVRFNLPIPEQLVFR
jgi:hypothetical protein